MQTKYTVGQRQGGAVLLVGMIMVLLMTVVGLSAIRGTGMQEQMAGNMRDMNLAFQAAEGALREGEQSLRDNIENFGSVNGYYLNLGDPEQTPELNPAGTWSRDDWVTRALVADSIGDAEGMLFEEPLFVVEELTYDCDSGSDAGGEFAQTTNEESASALIYRVTGRAVGGSENTVVLLQSTYLDQPCLG